MDVAFIGVGRNCSSDQNIQRGGGLSMERVWGKGMRK